MFIFEIGSAFFGGAGFCPSTVWVKLPDACLFVQFGGYTQEIRLRFVETITLP